MQLKTKFIIMIALITCCSYGVTFYRTSNFQEDLVVQQATRQAKMLFDQIKLTRQWVADHNGLFLVKEPGVEPNPFLPNAQIQDDEGNWLVKRNPAMVTRELSAYAAEKGMGQFNVTSLNPMNPKNVPDDFERVSLEQFNAGMIESISIEKAENSHRLRYMAPLEVDDRCLECHAVQGYKIGDIRGGMSVSIPIDWAYAEIRQNNRLLLNIAIATIIIVSLAIYFLFDLLVAKRLKLLARQMDSYPQKLPNGPNLDNLKDEIGSLNSNFHKLCDRLEQSQQELDKTREQVFQSEKQAALGRLVAGISHEINNPLGGMQNCIQTMKRSMDKPDLMERYMKLLGQGVERIKGTVQQLLNIGRKEPLEQIEGNVDEMLRDCLELTCVGRRNIELDMQLGIGRPLLVGMEALRQVVINLAGNAVQAMGETGGKLQVISNIIDQQLVISISDNGPGIAEGHLDKIFEPFFTTKEVGEGTGLGLSVSYSLIEQMDGELTAGNNSDGGAVFTISVPLQNKLETE
ncbi:His Kinase A (phospho-acceptor) domain-containing protein [Malonomonas rubra DSM 5091]|uniref:histidine kinase n=1 Tax=Malonomonas rubra DSM 5091 TaxID=1122189 RepID=A0A1M6MZG7_MALRU|nr:ATP-binding protein [Malonomonas rubra]SHJ88838.1 His Kinase A (phospho-acceptor) domain-containing protein [Malonomonas rubra DSM 5091]